MSRALYPTKGIHQVALRLLVIKLCNQIDVQTKCILCSFILSTEKANQLCTQYILQTQCSCPVCVLLQFFIRLCVLSLSEN